MTCTNNMALTHDSGMCPVQEFSESDATNDCIDERGRPKGDLRGT